MQTRNAATSLHSRSSYNGIALTGGSGYAGGTRERGRLVEFFAFDREYVRRLSDGDDPTERHFVEYFSGLLLAKLRNRLRHRDDLEDILQEVFLRVLRSLRQGSGVDRAECLGSYVNSICNHVICEHLRSKARAGQWDDLAPEPRDPANGVERDLVSEERCLLVRKLIDEMPPKGRQLMRAVFLEERDKDVVCQEQGVGRDYLRVLLHRAKKRFRELLAESQKPTARAVTKLTDLSRHL